MANDKNLFLHGSVHTDKSSFSTL